MTTYLNLDSLERANVACRQGALIEHASKSVASFFSQSTGPLSLQESQLGFPKSIVPYTADNRTTPHALISTGSKALGSNRAGRGFLQIKVYDFALYTNPQQLATHSPALAAHGPFAPISMTDHEGLQAADTGGSDRLNDTRQRARRRFTVSLRIPLTNRCGGRGTHAKQFTLTDRVRAATEHVEMSLCVRPARDLPLMMLRSEYARILRKRMQAVGGSTEDAALRMLLAYFKPSALPPAVTRRGCIKKGTVVLFSRTRGGELRTTADGTLVAAVRSPKLCEAVFDLYLGDAPVSFQGKAEARQALEHMLGMRGAAATTPRLRSQAVQLAV